MDGRGTLGRGLRVGLLVAGAPVLPWAALCLAVAAVEFLGGGDTGLAVTDLRYCGLLVGGSVLAGLLIGLVLTGGLALAARAFTGTRGLALVGGALGALLYPADLLVVAVGTDVGYAEVAVTFLLWPVMTVVAGAHAADVVGRVRRRNWLWGAGARGTR